LKNPYKRHRERKNPRKRGLKRGDLNVFRAIELEIATSLFR